MSLRIRKPFDGNWPVTQKFGVTYKYGDQWRKHFGVDFGCPGGTPILACEDGYILWIKRNLLPWGYGKEIRIKHNGFVSQYAHLSKILVVPLQKIERGELIGYSGRTGFVRGRTGYHLHFGILQNGKWIDPEPHFGMVIKKNDPLELTESGEKESVRPKPYTKRVLVYTVQPGDTLFHIAKEFYGDGEHWHKIFTANNKCIRDPNKIWPGQELVLPDLE